MAQLGPRWFIYGEPIGPERVEAEIRQTYHTGPNETKEDEVTRGTIHYNALTMMDRDKEIIKATHDDNSIELSSLSNEKEGKFLETFKPNQ